MEDVTSNISLQDLTEIEVISIRTLNVCEQNNLNDIISIVHYYWNNNDFIKLRNCGTKSNTELIKLCIKYEKLINKSTWIEKMNPKSSFHEEQILKNISLEKLAKTEHLSIRAQNICYQSDLKNAYLILKYYKENKEFINLGNCGQNTNTELILLCKKYKHVENLPQEPENLILKKIESLTVRQKKILNNIIESQVSELSVRSLNALNLYLDSHLNIKGLKPILSDKSFDIKNLTNVGEKSEEELLTFFSDITEQIEIISIFEDENELTIELFSSFLNKKFCLTPSILSEIGKNYNFSNGLPLFKTLQVLIDSEILFSKRDKVIIEKGFNYNTSFKVYSLDEIASNLGVTRERIRQRRIQIYDNFRSKISFIKGLEFEALNLYGVDIYSDIIILNDELISEINEKEQNSFNALFINKIFSILLNEKFTLIGNEESILFNKTTRFKHNWRNTYLIKIEITNVFDFEQYVEDVSRRLSERIEEDYVFHFETYLMDFQKDIISEHAQSIFKIAEHFLFSEFEMSVDIYENIIFKRNTIKQVFEYVYKALEDLGSPAKVDEIYKKVVEIYPTYNTDENSIRASMTIKTGFVSFGRTSVYGLKVWEDERDIRGGTIRDIAEEYLSNQTEPIHINKITEYVNRFRNTTSKNIYANLKMEVNSRFIFFGSLCIGLKAIKYEEENMISFRENQTARKTWEESFGLMKKFITKNERLPFSLGSPNEERLYRFMNVQLRKVKQDKLEPEKKTKILDLISSYPDKLRQRNSNGGKKNLEDNFKELERFYSSHKKWPKHLKSDKDQIRLYRFCLSIFKLYKNSELNYEQLKQLDNINFPYTQGAFIDVWLNNYEKLKEFRITNPSRWPQAKITELEKILYQFCYRNRNKYINGTLEDYKIQLLKEINFNFYG